MFEPGKDIVSAIAEQKAKHYQDKYGQYIGEAKEIYQERNEKYCPWSTNHEASLGKYLETYEQFMPIFEADTTTRDNMGDILKGGLGLVALSYGTLPVSTLASIQPLEDEAGVIYFRKLAATTTRAGVTAGDQLLSETGNPGNFNTDYYSEEIEANTNLVTDAGGGTPTASYAITLSAPVRPRSVDITITSTNGGCKAMDDGTGDLLGADCNGTIDYATGALVLTIDITKVVINDVIAITYHQNIAEGNDVPGFRWDLTSKVVRAGYFALQAQFTSLAEFTVQRRFGRALADDIAVDAVSQINSTVLYKVIRKLRTAALSNTTVSWGYTVPAGISQSEHRQTFLDTFESATTIMNNSTGRGAISFIVAGSESRKVLRNLGFKAQQKAVPGPYLLGDFEGIPVFYAPSDLIPNDEMIVGYRGNLWFESPVVYAPFLPVLAVKGQIGNNVFNQGQGVVHSAAVDTVIPGFAVRVQLVP